MADYLIIGGASTTISILTQCVWPFLKPHVGYWWCFDNNIQGLRAGIEDLKRQKRYIEQKSEEARLRTHILCTNVESWLKASTEKLEEAQKIMLQDDNIPKAWNITSRYSTGKRAKKTAEEIAKLRNEGNFNPIAVPAPPAAMVSPPRTSTMNIESRKGIKDEIIDCLKKNSVDMIGICGVGGVGKTTIAQRIGKRVKEEHLFDEVVTVTVSHTVDMPKIQNEIADLLKLKLDESSMTARANQLRRRLMDAKAKIIIFDDVRKSLRFEEFGLPIESNFERCKVLFTSRYADACKGIKNRKVFKLKILEGDEGWLLFKDKAGDCVEGSRLLNSVAKEVAAECKGLPIALVTVGLALQDVTNIQTWQNSLSQLRQSDPEDFPEVLRHVYKQLKSSYDYLDGDRERSLFLLCCLFPEDFNISVEQLTWYSMGLGLFEDITNIKEIRDRTHSLVVKLKSHLLLIDVEEKSKKGLEVKMHDVMRHLAIYIGSIEKNGFLKSLTSKRNSSDVNCNWMSVDISNDQMEVPVLSRFPKLRLLMLPTLSSNEFYDISRISFEGMENLNVLSFQNISIPSLPSTLGLLENLKELRLFHCQVENISVISELTSLKILSCCECKNITELPVEIGRLKGLRLLELNGCSNLQRIPFGVISRLVGLEELKIRRSFRRWEAEENGEQRRNASLTELEGLLNLTCLEIEISDCNCTLSVQETLLFQKLDRYRIWIAAEEYLDLDLHFDYFILQDRDYEKEMYLKLAGAVGNWIQTLARKAEFLRLRGDDSNNINLAEMENLRNLYFSECSMVKKLVDTSYLNQNVSLSNLKSIYIIKCSNLKHLFSVSVATARLLQLEDLHLRDCESMEQVFWNELTDNNTDGCIEFPKLKELTIRKLPNLTAFCQGLENINIKFPTLIELEIKDLPKLNSLLFCNPKDVSFSNLKSINIKRCSNLRSLFSVSAARRCLLQLEFLKIQDCELMEEVFWNEHTEDNTDGCIEFPKLNELRLWDLPNLTAFCQGLENIIIKFPNLTQMFIEGLPKLNSLSPLNSETDILQLEILSIQNCESMEQVFWNEDTDHNTDGCIEFPKLKKLILRDLQNLTAVCQGLENIIIKFPNLTQMSIRGLPKLNSLFPLTDLLQLEILDIEDCESMEQVFWNEIKDNNTDGCIEFPTLKKLELRNLPNLTAFCQGIENIVIKFPNLTGLAIGGLPKLNSLCPLNSETVVWHDQNTCFHFVCNPKVEMSLLKDLTFSTFEDNIKNIWCHQIPNNFFNNLERLDINNMNGIRSLMSTSIAKNFVSLEYLCISDCEEMVEVIEIDDDNEIQLVDINCLFPNLSELILWHLHELIRFWQWDHALELPLLKRVSISNCPAMETFTLGSVNTPNIKEISINNENIEDHKDLNNVIRHMRIKSQNTFETEDDWTEEDGDEDVNNSDERKDEYDNENVNKDDDDNVNVNKDEDDNEMM